VKNNSEGNLVPFVLPSGNSAPALRPVPRINPEISNERELTFSDLYHSVLQRWKLIAAITAGMIALMAIFCVTRDPLYSARSTIEIRGYAPVLAGATVESLLGADTRKLEYQKTTIAKLKQPGIADRVLSQSDKAITIAEYFGFTIRPVEPSANTDSYRDHGLQQHPKLISLYLNTIDINPVSETSLTQITVTTKDPQISRIIANAHAEGFIETLRLERQESMRTNLKALDTQSTELKTRLAHAEEEIAQYSEDNRLIIDTTAGSKDINVQKIVALSDALSKITYKRAESENTYKQMTEVGASNSSTLDNEAIRTWQFELSKLESEARTLGARVTSEYPEMIDIENKMKALQSSIARERQQLFKALSLTLESEKAAELRLIEQITVAESQVHDNLKKMARYTVLRKEADSLRELYETVLKQLQETTVSAASGVSNIYVSDWANEPQSPSYPKTSLMLIIATVIGLTLGLCIAWMLEFFDNRVKTSDDAAYVTGLPLLGVIPAFENSAENSRSQKVKKKLLAGPAKVDSTSLPEATQAQTERSVQDTRKPAPVSIAASPAISEALRTIRAGLLLSSVDAPVRVIMVTSAEKGEGKSTVAANLAVSLAQAEYRTLLIDADLRETSIAKFFPQVINKPGLSDLIAGQSDNLDSVVKNVVPFLDVLGAGSRPPNPAELVGSRKMSDAVKAFRSSYDFIIVDSPPVLPVADSLMLSHIVDGIIVVVRGGKSQRRNLKEAKRRLNRVRGNLVGIVVNDMKPSRDTGYGDLGNSAYFSAIVEPEDTSSLKTDNDQQSLS
jgi:capsular exopolysaccharide synthesis family protein